MKRTSWKEVVENMFFGSPEKRQAYIEGRKEMERLTGVSEKTRLPHWSEVVRDRSFWVLLVSNVVAIYFIRKSGMGIKEAILVCWAQGVIIGLVNALRIFMLKDTFIEDTKTDGGILKVNLSTKFRIALLFIYIYGFIQLGTIVVINEVYGDVSEKIDFLNIFFISLSFAVSHIYSFIYNLKEETEKRDVFHIFFSPITRSYFMYLAAPIAGIWSMRYGPAGSLMAFLIIKTGIDLFAHTLKHKKTLRQPEGIITNENSLPQ